MDEKQLYVEIEKRRKEMNRISKQKPLTSPDIINISKELDDLLNQWQSLHERKSTKVITQKIK